MLCQHTYYLCIGSLGRFSQSRVVREHSHMTSDVLGAFCQILISKSVLKSMAKRKHLLSFTIFFSRSKKNQNKFTASDFSKDLTVACFVQFRPINVNILEKTCQIKACQIKANSHAKRSQSFLEQ